MCSVFLQTASVLNFINLITLFICYTWTNILQNAENFSLYFNKRWMNPDKSLVNVCFCEVSGFYFHCFSFLVLRLRHALVWNTSEHHSSVFCFYEHLHAFPSILLSLFQNCHVFLNIFSLIYDSSLEGSKNNFITRRMKSENEIFYECLKLCVHAWSALTVTTVHPYLFQWGI